jgi:RNA 2',3'-cyclic 3'-phosphodiesterase
MTRRGPSARLFVAVDPPAPVADELAAWARIAARALRGGAGEGPSAAPASARAGSPALRVLDPELLHVTVCFLGDRPVSEIPSLADELAACERPPVRLSVGAPVWLPPRRPRALAVELHDEDGTLASIHAQLAARLEPAAEQPHPPPRPSGARAKPRRFRPHVTVARLRPDGRRRPRAHGRAASEPTLPATPALSFAASELVLYRSWLSPEGASYEAVAKCQLG